MFHVSRDQRLLAFEIGILHQKANFFSLLSGLQIAIIKFHEVF